MGLKLHWGVMGSHTVQRKRRDEPQRQIGLSSLLPKHEEGSVFDGLRILLENNFETEKKSLKNFARPRFKPVRRIRLSTKIRVNDSRRTMHAAAPLQSNGPFRTTQPRFGLFASNREPSHRLREETDPERSVQTSVWQSPPPPSKAPDSATAPSASPPGTNQDGQLVELHKFISSSQKQDSVPVYKKQWEDARHRDYLLKDLHSEISLQTSRLESLRKTRVLLRIRDTSEDKEITTSVAFTPLSEEEEEEVRQALHGANRHEVLVQHEQSNIDLTRAAMQCLKPGVWLNDEVINLYLELLKEREHREPKNFMKCHFFNTFFFNKLYKDARSYDFKAVRRWTTHKKLGYNLLECDKIFVPIHKDIHWCLAVINVREKKLHYLDSLKGNDGNALQVLARYLEDEAMDKQNKKLDVSTWERDCAKDIPEQLNGCDCGMFMIKYADFYSRGDHLKFTQEHMEYFRKRTVLELLQLKAR